MAVNRLICRFHVPAKHSLIYEAFQGIVICVYAVNKD